MPTLPPDSPDDLDVPADGEPGPPCARCGLPMPPLPVAVRRALDAGLAVELSHPEGGCPTDVVHPEGRYFEVRVEIVEVREPEPLDDSYLGSDAPQVIDLISFKAGLREKDLDTAMRPLAAALGEKWQAAEKQARIADQAATS